MNNYVASLVELSKALVVLSENDFRARKDFQERIIQQLQVIERRLDDFENGITIKVIRSRKRK